LASLQVAHVEQQPPDRIGWVIDRPAQAQTHLAFGQVYRDRVSVGQRPGQPVELGHHQGVTGPAGKCFTQTRPVPFGTGQPVIDVDALIVDAKLGQTVALGGEILLLGRDTGIADQKSRNDDPRKGEADPRQVARPSTTAPAADTKWTLRLLRRVGAADPSL
jgi:hypothetical protein